MKNKILFIFIFNFLFLSQSFSQKIEIESCKKCNFQTMATFEDSTSIVVYSSDKTEKGKDVYDVYVYNSNGKLLKKNNLLVEKNSFFQSSMASFKDKIALSFYKRTNINTFFIDKTGKITNGTIEVSKKEKLLLDERNRTISAQTNIDMFAYDDFLYITTEYKNGVGVRNVGTLLRKISPQGKVIWEIELNRDKGGFYFINMSSSKQNLYIVNTQRANSDEDKSDRALTIIDKNKGTIKHTVELINSDHFLMPHATEKQDDGVLMAGIYFEEKDSKGIFVAKYNDKGEVELMKKYDWLSLYNKRMPDSSTFVNFNFRLYIKSISYTNNHLHLVAEEFSTGLNLLTSTIGPLSLLFTPNTKVQTLKNILLFDIDINTGQINDNSFVKFDREKDNFTLPGIALGGERGVITALYYYGRTRVLQIQKSDEKISIRMREGKKTIVYRINYSNYDIKTNTYEIKNDSKKTWEYIFLAANNRILHIKIESQKGTFWYENL